MRPRDDKKVVNRFFLSANINCLFLLAKTTTSFPFSFTIRSIFYFFSLREQVPQEPYHAVMESLLDTNDNKVEGDWMKIWNLNIPPKIKHFLWRSPRNCLPTTLLAAKGVHCQFECSFCSQHFENERHLFLSCPKAKEYWQHAGLSNTI